MVATALIAAMVLNIGIPVWVIALIVMGLGLSLTYMTALITLQRQDLEELQTLGRVRQELYKTDSCSSLIQHLETAARRLISGEEVKVMMLESDPNLANIKQEGSEFAVNLAESSDGKADRLLLPVKGIGPRVIICLQRRHQPTGFSAREKKCFNIIVNDAELMLSRLNERKRQNEFAEQLLHTAVKANEGWRPGFAGHGARVALVADMLGKRLGLDVQEYQDLHYAALLHDIGRANLAEGTDEEHPARGAAVFPADGAWTSIREAVYYHHERYDGSGFPEGQKMTDIPLLARIIAVADIYDGLTRLAPEEDRLPPKLAVQAILKATGTSFDPLVVVALQEISAEIEYQLIQLEPADHTADGQ